MVGLAIFMYNYGIPYRLLYDVVLDLGVRCFPKSHGPLLCGIILLFHYNNSKIRVVRCVVYGFGFLVLCSPNFRA